MEFILVVSFLRTAQKTYKKEALDPGGGATLNLHDMLQHVWMLLRRCVYVSKGFSQFITSS